ncbi:hypothetical protein Bca4012_071855 [Brassica carinata]
MTDIKQKKNDDFDASKFLMVVMVARDAQFQNLRKRLMGQHSIERPLRRPVTMLGEQYIHKGRSNKKAQQRRNRRVEPANDPGRHHVFGRKRKRKYETREKIIASQHRLERCRQVYAAATGNTPEHDALSRPK